MLTDDDRYAIKCAQAAVERGYDCQHQTTVELLAIIRRLQAMLAPQASIADAYDFLMKGGSK